MLLEIILIVVAILFVVVLFRALKKIWPLVVNSVFALIVLWLLNAIFKLGVIINIWSILVVAIGGFAGLLLVVLLHILGIAF